MTGGSTQTRIREAVSAIAAEVIAETMERLGAGRPGAAPLRIAHGKRSAPRPTSKRGGS